MTITRERSGEIVFHCEFCSDILETETSNFGDAVDAAKSKRWGFIEEDRIWTHYCPSCWEEL